MARAWLKHWGKNWFRRRAGARRPAQPSARPGVEALERREALTSYHYSIYVTEQVLITPGLNPVYGYQSAMENVTATTNAQAKQKAQFKFDQYLATIYSPGTFWMVGEVIEGKTPV